MVNPLMKLDRLGDITSELSTNLVSAIVLPGGLLEWLTRPLPGRLRDRFRSGVAKESAAEPQRNSAPVGPLVLMGGQPVPDESIVAMIHLAGGRSAKLAVIPVATSNHEQAAEQGVKLFTRFGMRKVEIFDLITRERADSPEWAKKLSAYDAVFLCGEDEATGIDVLGGTLCANTLREMSAAGKPIAGLSAGAAILADQVFVRRNDDDVVVPGLGLASGMLVNTRFGQENRFARLTKALQADSTGRYLGVGLDAGSAVAIRDGEAKVLGETSVTFMDLRDSQVLSDQGGSAVCGLKVHVLLDGYVMNLRTRRPSGPPKEPPAQAAGAR
ncbi:MAG TPA: cyanophycinase [Symbiobacteriaceae bacterium]|nr:cyanophycinase [Symbiobacteriaceae bacterium]